VLFGASIDSCGQSDFASILSNHCPQWDLDKLVINAHANQTCMRCRGEDAAEIERRRLKLTMTTVRRSICVDLCSVPKAHSMQDAESTIKGPSGDHNGLPNVKPFSIRGKLK
jgi:hypothetical protein